MSPIIRACAWRVRVPLLEEWASSPEFGMHPSGDKLILCVTDADGREGWGEGKWNVSEPLLGECLRSLTAPDTLGWWRTSSLETLPPAGASYWEQPLPPSPYAPPLENLRHRLRHPAQAAVETALLDLAGKALGAPFHAFFGGAWRTAVNVDYWMGRTTPDHARRCARRAVDLGFEGIKLKTTLQDPNVERLEAIRQEAGADFAVTVDPNGRFYRLDDAWRIIKAMDAVGNMRILEDPFPRIALAESRELRRRIEARLVIHVDPPEMLAELIRSDACGGLNLDSHAQGLFNWRLQAAVADQFNLPVWHGSGSDLGIYTAAQLHLAASAPNCQLPGDQAGPWIREHTLIREPFVIESGKVRVPSGNGLGVTVDRDALERYTKLVLTQEL